MRLRGLNLLSVGFFYYKMEFVQIVSSSGARALAGGFCDAGLAQLVALASPDSEDLRIDVAKLHVEGLGGEPELTRDFGKAWLGSQRLQ